MERKEVREKKKQKIDNKQITPKWEEYKHPANGNRWAANEI